MSPSTSRDIWPSSEEIKATVADAVRAEMFTKSYADVFSGDERWQALDTPDGDRYTWPDSTYVRRPPFFEEIPPSRRRSSRSRGARVLAVLGDSVTTDHISPAGAIKKDSPAGEWLIEQGVEPRDFNSYGSRRGNHEVMMRGTFANVRLRNKLVEREGGYTKHFPDGEQTTIYDAAMATPRRACRWSCSAARSTARARRATGRPRARALLGVRAVIAESFERIHRSNLIGMGVLPLQFPDGESAESLGLTGEETFDVGDLDDGEAKTVAGHGQPRRGRRRSRSRRRSGSTPRTRSATSETAASSTRCCATSTLADQISNAPFASRSSRSGSDQIGVGGEDALLGGQGRPPGPRPRRQLRTR